MIRCLLLLVLLPAWFLALPGCMRSGASVDEPETEPVPEGSSYHRAEIGWRMAVPDGWTVTDEAQLEAYQDRGTDLSLIHI